MHTSTDSRVSDLMDETDNISYKFPDAEQSNLGTCIHLSGSGILFRAKRPIESGLALEVTIAKQGALTSSLIAYVEVMRTSKIGAEIYEVATVIKGIKEN